MTWLWVLVAVLAAFASGWAAGLYASRDERASYRNVIAEAMRKKRVEDAVGGGGWTLTDAADVAPIGCRLCAGTMRLADDIPCPRCNR